MQKNKTSTHFAVNEVQQLARLWFGLEVTVQPLESYIDWNFLVTDAAGNRYVLKIANESESLLELEAQNGVLKYLASQNPEIPCPRVVPNLNGADITPIQNPQGSTLYLRLLSYLPGTFLGQKQNEPHAPELLHHLGHILGTMDRSLSSFFLPGAYRYLRWDLKNTADLEQYLHLIPNQPTRNLVSYYIQLFKSQVLPVMSTLRSSVIYNDANDFNVLVSEDGKKVAGIIDFGDMVFTHTVCELAIAIAYAVFGQEDLLATACQVVAGYHRAHALTEAELDVLYYLIAARFCATLVNGARQMQETPDNAYLNVSLTPARVALQRMLTIDPGYASMRFRQSCGLPLPDAGLAPEEILEIRAKHLGKSLSVSYQKPLKIVRGFMQYLYDYMGRAYLDTVNNVCHVGHCHPKVVAAAQRQNALLNTNTRYLHDAIIEYARQLVATLPSPLSVCFFVCTGSEANELALRMARVYTGATDFVVVDHAYHGNTSSIIEISPYKFDGPGGKGAPAHVHKAMLPDGYRGIYKYTDLQAAEKYAGDVRRVFAETAGLGRKVAAFIHESVPGVAGQVFFPEGYLARAYACAREHRALCIADEVQAGFGRVGSHMWAFQLQGVVPDIVTMGKPIGNGHPLAAVVTTPEIADAFNNGMEYFNTFGGNPVSCAIGLSVLEVIREEGLQENSRVVGQYMKEGLQELVGRHRLVGDVRGEGLFIGIELVTDRERLTPAKEQAAIIAERMKEAGILVSVDGPLHNVLKIKPPIVFTRENALQYVETLDQILVKMEQ